MCDGLSDYEKRQIERMLESASRRERQTALSNQRGFLHWLGNVGLGAIVVKLAKLAWTAIRAFFGF